MTQASPRANKNKLNVKVMLLVTMALFAFLSLADDLSGTYEFPPPEGMEGDSAIVQLYKGEEGKYFAQVSVAEETIEGTNVVVGENQFSFDIVVETPDGDMLQVYTVKLDDGKFTLSILSDLGGRSQSITLKGKVVNEIEGSYTFPPPEGVQGDTTKIQLAKNEDDNFSVIVTVGTETIEALNVIVKSEEFSFDTEVKTEIGNMSQAWKIEVADNEATLSILADVGGQSQSMTLKGSRVEEEPEIEN